MVAIISDIHANSTALHAVLADIQRRKIQQIYCLGDLVDYGPAGNEVIDIIRKRGIPCILGNHDEGIAYDRPILRAAFHPEAETAARIAAINYSKKSITQDNKEWLKSLPYEMELTFKTDLSGKKIRIMLVHGSLKDNKEYIYENNPNQHIIDELNKRSVNMLVMGHTHLSYIKKIDNLMLVNAGSVGRNKEYDRKAVYTVVSFGDNELKAEIIKVDYDIQSVVRDIYNSEIPDFYADFLLYPENSEGINVKS